MTASWRIERDWFGSWFAGKVFVSSATGSFLQCIKNKRYIAAKDIYSNLA